MKRVLSYLLAFCPNCESKMLIESFVDEFGSGYRCTYCNTEFDWNRHTDADEESSDEQ